MLALAVFATVLCVGDAAADDVQGTRSDRLTERSHVVHVEMDHGHARLTVRRTVHNASERHDQAQFRIDLPPGAVAAGLRTLGTQGGRPRWFAGDLFEAELAARRYRELTGIGGYYPKDPALLSWRQPDLLALQVFPVAPNTDKTIEYTLYVPTRYEDGRFRVELGALGTEKAPGDLVIRPAHARDQLFVDANPVGAGIRLRSDHVTEIALARHDAPRLSGDLAVVSTGHGRSLVQFELEAAPKLSTRPDRADVVVILDMSRSLEAARAAAQVAAAQAYLEHFVDPGARARAQVLTFDRRVTARQERLVPVGEAVADLEHMAIERGNGSEIGGALRRARATFASASHGRARRILLMTDTLTRHELTPARLRVLARQTGAVVHIGRVFDGEPDLVRIDSDEAWAAVARATGGLLWRGQADVATPRDPDLVATVEQWVRPMQIDNLELHAPGLDLSELDDESLREGQGFTNLILTDHVVRHVVLRGELWATPVRQAIVPSSTHGTLWSGLVFGSELLDELSEAEMMVLAQRGQVVSPVTSYLAIEPGVRPSTEGLDWNGIGVGGLGLIGSGSGGGGGHGFGVRRIDPAPTVAAAVREALDTCGIPQAHVEVAMQTTLDEIAALDRVVLRGTSDPAAQECLTEALWDTALPRATWPVWKRWAVKV